MRPVVKLPVVQYNKEDYAVMRVYLLEQIGSYCSYCEQPISNDSAVEHKVPQNDREGFISFATRWFNLLLACGTCNSAKGKTPAKVPPSPGNELLWYLQTSAYWAWPDRVQEVPPPVPVDQSYLLFKPDRQTLSQVTLFGRGLVKLGWPKTSPPAWATTPYDRVWIFPNDAYINAQPNAAELKAKVDATIFGLNLNRYNTENTNYSDRRVENRTAAYDMAIAAFNILQNYWQATYNPPASSPNTDTNNLLLRTIRTNALSCGFWSVWFKVFRDRLHNPQVGNFWHAVPVAVRKELLERSLVSFSPAERQNRQDVPIFPGTDIGRLDLGSFR